MKVLHERHYCPAHIKEDNMIIIKLGKMIKLASES